MTTRSVVVALRAEMAQFKKEWAEAGKLVKQVADEMERAGQKSGKAEKDTARQATAMGRMTDRLKNHRSEWDQVGTSFLSTGAVIALGVGMIAKSAVEWETAWAGVTKTVSGTPGQMNELENSLRGLAKTMPETHAEIAGVAEAAGQLGVARKDVAAFTKTMVMLGDTTDLTSQGAATSFAQLMNVMQTAPGKVDNLGSALVALGNKGASTESQILGMAQRLASTGKIVGFTEEEVLGLASAMANTGIEVEAGGSAMSNVLIAMSKSVATGNKDLGVFANVAGQTANEFAAKWKSAPASALADFTEGLGYMAQSGKDVFSVLDELGLSDVRVTRALLNMANSGDNLRTSFDLSAEAARKNTALIEEADRRYDTTAAKAKIAWNNIKDSAIDAGQGLLPVISEIADVVTGLSDAFGGLSEPVQSSLGLLAGGVAVTLLAAGGFMKVVGSIQSTKVALDALAISAPRTTGALTAIGRAAGIVGAALLALRIAGDLGDMDETAAVNKYTTEILKLGKGGKDAAKGLNGLITTSQGIGSHAKGWSALSTAIDKAGKSALNQKFGSIFGVVGMNPYQDAIDDVKAYDTALTDLVARGATEEAAAGYKTFIDAAKDAGKSTKEAKELLPGYTGALGDLKNEAKLSGDEIDKFGNKLGGLSPEAQAAKDAMNAARDAAHAGAMAFFDFGANLDTNQVSFENYIKGLEGFAKDVANWSDNLLKAMSKGVDSGFLAGLVKEGPAAAARLAEVANATEDEVARINAAFRDTQGVADFQAAIAHVPAEVLTEFNVAGTDDAVEKVAALGRELKLHPDTVETIMTVFDFSSKEIKAVRDLMQDLDKKEARPKIDANVAEINRKLDLALNALGVVDKKRPKPKVDADISPLNSKLSLAQRIINNLTGKTVTINAVRGGNGWNIPKFTGGQVPQGFAGGGVVPGTSPANPYEDNMWARGANTGQMMTVRSGEWIINEEQSRINDGWLRAINNGLNLDDLFGDQRGFVDGGRVDDMSAWDASFQAAAASYSRTAPAAMAATNSGSNFVLPELTARLADRTVQLGGDGLLRLLDDRVHIGIQSNARHQAASNRRKGGR